MKFQQIEGTETFKLLIHITVLIYYLNILKLCKSIFQAYNSFSFFVQIRKIVFLFSPPYGGGNLLPLFFFHVLHLVTRSTN
uniref:Putative ovule protein n=1 Tax=Solanum chacoense TaxID=4108 RepID=A0A0V0HF99_SOLCH